MFVLSLSYAVFRFASIHDCHDPYIIKAQLDISRINEMIALEREGRIFSSNDSRWINGLSRNTQILFDGNDTNHPLLEKGIVSGKHYGEWETTDTHPPYINYLFHTTDNTIVFRYNTTNGTFDCLAYNSGETKKVCFTLLKAAE